MGGAAQTIEDVGGDALATLTGNAELIPLINAGVSAANGGGVTGALEAGGEALAGQELAGAVGIGQGNTAFNSALGITGDTPTGTGLPDIGAAASNAIGATGGAVDTSSATAPATASTSPTATTAGGAPANAAGQATTTPATTTSTTQASGGGFTPAANVSDLSTSAINTNLSNDVSGTATQGSPGLGNVASNAIGATDTGAGLTGQFQQAAGNAPTLSSQSLDALTSLTPTGETAISSNTPSSAGSNLLNKAENIGIQAALPLGALAYDAIKGPTQLPGSATQLEAGGAATAPLLALETQGATEASTGQLTPTQQANILQGVQQQQNALIQQLASEGVQNPTQDSRYIAGLQQIQQWALAQQQAYITQAISEATSAGGAASSNIATVANEQIQQDQDFQNSLSAALGALGGALGGVNVTPKVTA